MFKEIKKTAIAEFDLCAMGPILVGSGTDNECDPRLPDNTFLMGSNGEEMTFVIPGSTIKGVIRNCVYDQVDNGTLDVNIAKLFGNVKQKEKFAADKYETESTQKSKVSFYDAYADMKTVVSDVRYSTAIYPVLQTAKEKTLNNMLVVEKGIFKASFKLINYTDDEMRAIITALRKVNEGVVRFGGKTSRGFGQMKIDNFKMTVRNGFDEMLNPIIEKEYSDFEKCAEEVIG